MKILFFPIYISTPHFETELELIEKHIQQKDEIIIVNCNKQLKTCLANPLHSIYRCIMCQSRFKSGLKKLSPNKVQIINFSADNKYELIPTIFKDLENVKDFKINDIEIGLGAASSLISRLNREHKLDTIYNKEEVGRDLQTSYDIYLFFISLLKEKQPDLVYFFNGRLSSIHAALHLCEIFKIHFFTHERAGIINKYCLFKNSIPHDTQYAAYEIKALWEKGDENKENIGTQFFTDRRKGIVQSWHSFNKLQKPLQMPDNFDSKKRNIAIFNSGVEEFFSIKGWEKPFNFYDDEFDGITKILESFKTNPDFIFYLRIHPNLKNFNNSQTRNLYSLKAQFLNLCIINPESSIDSYALIENTEKIIVFGSTIGVEACYWKKPSIALAKSFYEGLDCCYYPKSHEEVIQLIQKELAPKPQIEAIKYGYWELQKGYFYKYFNQTGLQSGYFKGKKVQASFIKKIFAVLTLFLKAKNVKEIYQTIKENV